MGQVILIMGLSGSGKTTLASSLDSKLQLQGKKVKHLNADLIRAEYNDWDFSVEGRLRQGRRIALLAQTYRSETDYVLCDLIAPLPLMRSAIGPDVLVWVNSVSFSKFKDTDDLFVPPSKFDIEVTSKDSEYWSTRILSCLNGNKFDFKKPTVQMLGRWQPWHAGHRALFERSIAKTGQVCIMIRDCQGVSDSNPFSIDQVIEKIHADLQPEYLNKYIIQVVPNITNITYGRDVGYSIEQEVFDVAITSISATKIRESLTSE